MTSGVDPVRTARTSKPAAALPAPAAAASLCVCCFFRCFFCCCCCRRHTLRAKYGASSAKPAVHCTDLPEDGPLECEYVFALLPQP